MGNRPGPKRVDAAERIAVLQRAVFESEAVTDRATRAARATGGDVSDPLGSCLTKVREASHRITDGDIAALHRAGHGEEEIFELTVAAALGAALHRRDAGLRALRGDT